MIRKKINQLRKESSSLLTRLLMILLIPGLMIFSPPDIFSAQKSGATSLTSKSKVIKKKKRKTRRRRSRRSYNPIATRAKALEIIRRNSETLCELSGLQPILDGEKITFDDAEEVEEIEEIADEIEYCESQLTANGVVYDDDESSELTESEINNMPVDIETFRTLWLSYVDEGKTDEYTEGGIHKQSLMKVVLGWLGTPYRFGGATRRALDCSAFSRAVIFESSNITIPRTARSQFLVGEPVLRGDLQFGDLIFFHTYSYSFASHVGIYLADGLFVHASSKFGVTITSLNASYYASHFIGARRLHINDWEEYVEPIEISSTGE